jgi:hypothetical protein
MSIILVTTTIGRHLCRFLDPSLQRWHPRPTGAAGQIGGVT